MLRFNRSPFQAGQDGATADVSHSAEQSLAELYTAAVGFLHRQFLVILLVLPVTIGLALAFIFMSRPSLRALRVLMLTRAKCSSFPQSIIGDDPVTGAIVDSQIEVIKSENFALLMLKKLHLSQGFRIRWTRWADRHHKKILLEPPFHRTPHNPKPNSHGGPCARFRSG